MIGTVWFSIIVVTRSGSSAAMVSRTGSSRVKSGRTLSR